MQDEAKILVIDDDSGIGEMMKLMLEFDGYRVFVSEKPGEAEEIIMQNNIDLVILDMLISGVNGTDVCRRLRKNDTQTIGDIPILMMSALHDAHKKCKLAGASDFIAKPFEMEQLIQKIESLLKN